MNAGPIAPQQLQPRVTVCVATKNRTDMLHQFLWSLIRQEYAEWNLLIVDDSDVPVRWDRLGVYPRLFAEMKRTRHEVRMVPGPRVNRIGAAYQAGLIASPREVPLFFRADDDSWMEPDCLAKLVAVMDDEDVGACGGLFLHPGGAEIDTLMPDDPRYRHATIEGLSDHFNIQWHRHYADNPVPVEHLTANILFSRKWLEAIGGFETTLYRQHRDETQATWRLHVAGAKLFVRPDAVTWHLRGSTGGARGHHPDVYIEDHRRFMAQRRTMQQGIHISLGHAIGDGFMATPMLSIMRKMNPDRNIAVFAPWAKDVLYGNPNVDAIAEHALDHQRTVRLEQSVYNWASSNQWKGHLAEAYCRMFNLPLPDDVTPHFHFVGDESSDELPLSDFVVIAPWSSAKTFDYYQASGTKNWLMDRWKSVVEWAHRNDFKVVQLRGSHDEPLLESVDLDFACRPLRAAFGCIRKARLLVSVDTMAHHAAAALGVPTVVLWGRSKPEHFGYRRDNIINLQGTCPGVPVQGHVCHEGTTDPVPTTVIRDRPCINGDQWSMDREPCPIEGHPCMAGISTRQVIDAMESLLSSKIPVESDGTARAKDRLSFEKTPHGLESDRKGSLATGTGRDSPHAVMTQRERPEPHALCLNPTGSTEEPLRSPQQSSPSPVSDHQLI